jgi:thiamine-phosphate pyrophosphorylase
MLAPAAWQTGGVERAHEPKRRRGANLRERLRAARLYLVCGAQDDGFLDAALRGGVDVVQLRLKDAPDEEIVSTARRFARLCAAHGALFILNDRPELVADAGADGVHVGQDDMSVGRARALVGAERLVGRSTHTPTQVDTADELPDYIGVGPVYETPTKPGRQAVGLDLIRYAREHAVVPFVAIGGIDERTVGGAVEAGARRIAVVRALVEAQDPEAAARRLKRALHPKREPVGAA